MTRLLGLVLAALLAGCMAVPPDMAQAGPVVAIDQDFPDPAVLRAPDGYYYAYATQGDVGGRKLNIQVARSTDLVRWEHVGDALPAKPAWASRTQDFWAPHVSAHGKRYLMYYSAKPDAALSDDTKGLCLAVASSDAPQGPFTDMGHPLLCGEGFMNIDPMAFDDPASGHRLLYWGSGFGPIKVQELSPDGLSFAPGSTPTPLVDVVKTEDPANYRRLVEGAWVVHREGWYYLFFSGDNCCGPNAHYAVMVARSRAATGPFEVKPECGGVILSASPGWLAPGHNSTIADGSGGRRIVYHAIDPRQPRPEGAGEGISRRVMLIDTLEWKGGWPAVSRRGPAVPLGKPETC